MPDKVGLIGLGNAGLALATPLMRRFAVVGYDRDAGRRALASNAGVTVAASAAAVAEQCELVMLSLPAPAISKAVIGEIGLERLEKRLIVETGTVMPHDIDDLIGMTAPAGASVMDCAIVGGVHKLAEGKTTFLVGATDSDFKRAKPVLDSAAEDLFHLGRPGNGMRAKLINNAVAHAVMVVLVEAAAIGAAQGVPVEVFYELMRRESGLLRPLTHRFGDRIFKQDFEGGMATANAHKDSALVLDVARELGVPLFAIPAAHTAYEIAMHEGLDRKDYSAISKLWERWLGISLAPKH
ncbi:MAG: NAD(P)-dependent oxidoreductase [Betaproteobacteria bacterium]|nr:NAD(P)-dependent oxidoreductase [Betaproteobacteria bacterium]